MMTRGTLPLKRQQEAKLMNRNKKFTSLFTSPNPPGAGGHNEESTGEERERMSEEFFFSSSSFTEE